MRLLRGLRARLIIVLLLVATVSAVVASGLAYAEARNLILDRTQEAVLKDFRHQVTRLAEELEFPPDKGVLQRLVEDVKPAFREAGVAAYFRDLSASSELFSARIGIPADLREAVRSRRGLQYQRIVRDDQPWLVLGTPVTFSKGQGPSGLEVYAVVSLDREGRDADDLLWEVSKGALPIVLLSGLLALLAARGVLRPVRDLGRAARRLAGGDLGARLKPTGSDELADLARTFNDTAGALETSVADLRHQEAMARRFVADVSHELRTPLAAMSAVADVLDEDAERLPPDTAAAARLVSRETTNLVRLVNDLIEISRFDAGAATLVVGELDMGWAIQASLRARGWQDQVRADLPQEVRARLDHRRLDVIVANLVGNALRHGAPPVVIGLRADTHNLEITVSDHGPGLSPEVRANVFDRFYKADTARARSEGSGLGLAIARENARLHGGDITVEDRPGGGAVFLLRLPLEAGR